MIEEAWVFAISYSLIIDIGWWSRVCVRVVVRYSYHISEAICSRNSNKDQDKKTYPGEYDGSLSKTTTVVIIIKSYIYSCLFI